MLEAVDDDHESSVQKVWTLSGRTAIADRTNQLVDNAAGVVLVTATKPCWPTN